MESSDIGHHFDSFVVDTPSAGSLLLSEPLLRDENFSRTAVLVCERETEGVVGYVVNRKSAVNLREVLARPVKMDFPLYIGGPVQPDTLHFLHRIPRLKEDSEGLDNGVFWGKDIEHLFYLIDKGKINTADVKFFMGYAGWDSEQFQEELNASAWIVNNHIRAAHVFDYPSDTLWHTVLKEMGGKYGMLADYPKNPTWN